MIKPLVLTHLAAPFFSILSQGQKVHCYRTAKNPTSTPSTRRPYLRHGFNRRFRQCSGLQSEHHHARSPATPSSSLHQREPNNLVLASSGRYSELGIRNNSTRRSLHLSTWRLGMTEVSRRGVVGRRQSDVHFTLPVTILDRTSLQIVCFMFDKCLSLLLLYVSRWRTREKQP
ncbi:hypothetical protein EDD85DRAFT_277928 [Armillaria nabsnona]|nr:hypothetical protein EDD85DRAFT_277928 [Armillaria nabsnona]